MSDGQIEGFKKLFDELMRYCLHRGIGFADAQDLVGASVESALKKFDPARGGFAALAQTTLTNRVKNYWRDRKPVDPLDAAGEITDPDASPEIFDEMSHDHERLRGIMAELTIEEKEFLLVLQSVLDDVDTRAVSEAARRMGMQPAKGWDLFRKIQRKAIRGTVVERRRAMYTRPSIPPPADLAVFEESSVSIMMELPAPSAAGPERAGEPFAMRGPRRASIDLSVRALAAFAAMEQAFTHFCAGLSPESAEALKTIK
jgi:DNA-directed RNA polymerase specialized sigma24 family protein